MRLHTNRGSCCSICQCHLACTIQTTIHTMIYCSASAQRGKEDHPGCLPNALLPLLSFVQPLHHTPQFLLTWTIRAVITTVWCIGRLAGQSIPIVAGRPSRLCIAPMPWSSQMELLGIIPMPVNHHTARCMEVTGRNPKKKSSDSYASTETCDGGPAYPQKPKVGAVAYATRLGMHSQVHYQASQ